MSSRPGYTLCVCPDNRLIKEHIEERLTAAMTENGTLWERHVFWGDEALPPIFWEHLTLQGLFSTPKAVIIHNAQNIPADTWKRLSAALAKPCGDTWPFFCLNVDFERGKPKIPAHIDKLACVAFARKNNWFWTSPGLDKASMTAFIRKEAKRLGCTLAPGSMEALLPRLLPDATAIALEIEKLTLATGTDHCIKPEHAALLDHETELDIFSLIRSLQDGNNMAAVWRQVASSQQGSDSQVFSFLAMLAREARQLWQILAGQTPYLPPQVLAAKERLARSLGFSGVGRLWQLALEADKGVKSGERDTDQAMESLMAGLYMLFTRGKRAPQR